MTTNTLVEIRSQLFHHQDKAYREKIRAFVPTEAEIIGVRLPAIRQLVNMFFQTRKREFSFDDACELTDAACQNRCREEALFAVLLLAKFKHHFSSKLWPSIDRWIDHIENWETCDQLAANILLPVFLKDMQFMDELVEWTKSPNLWRRRITAATMAALHHGKRKYPQETFRICENLMTDQEPMVRKAVGWALRDTSNENPVEVRDFLKRWRPTIAKGLLTESAKKLPPQMRRDLELNQ